MRKPNIERHNASLAEIEARRGLPSGTLKRAKAAQAPTAQARAWMDGQGDRKSRRQEKAAANKEAKADERAKVRAAAVEYAREGLRWYVKEGVFGADFENQRAQGTAQLLHSGVFGLIDALVAAGTPATIIEYLTSIASVSADYGATFNKLAQEAISSFPADTRQDPTTNMSMADVKEYTLRHLLPNFANPESLRAYHLGRGQRLSLITHDGVIGSLVELLVVMFDVGVAGKYGACGCIAEALGQLGVFTDKSTVKSACERSSSAAQRRARLAGWPEPARRKMREYGRMFTSRVASERVIVKDWLHEG
jgi:hypothetical protein